MKGSHIPLVVMSIVALVVYVIPFTILVLLGPWLQARSGHCLLRWVNKIKPLLDAYQVQHSYELPGELLMDRNIEGQAGF